MFIFSSGFSRRGVLQQLLQLQRILDKWLNLYCSDISLEHVEYEQVTDFCHLSALYHSCIIFCLLKEQFHSLQDSSSSSPKAVCITNAKGCCMSIIHTVNIIFVCLNLPHSSLPLPVANFPTCTCRVTFCRFSFACSKELLQSVWQFLCLCEMQHQGFTDISVSPSEIHTRYW